MIWEDFHIYNAQQRAIGGDPEGASAAAPCSRVLIGADRALTLARRVIDRLLAAEAAERRWKRKAPAAGRGFPSSV
ncbi:MAG: hypothetical protein EXQ96_04150 [Alphaproteobacteria bacterium]|nr:hypothetical protein [Alphaproteobacteria bacterium]